MEFQYKDFKSKSIKLMDFIYSNTVHIFKNYEKSGQLGIHINSAHFPESVKERQTSQEIVTAILKSNDDNIIQKYILIEFARSLIFDACNNFYEAIWAIRRDNYKIAFQLIRKPLEETILHLESIVSDTQNYVDFFKQGKPKTLYLSSH